MPHSNPKTNPTPEKPPKSSHEHKERLRVGPHPNPLLSPLRIGDSVLLWIRVCDKHALEMRAASLLPQLGPFWRVVPASKDKQKLELYRWQTSNIGWEKLKNTCFILFRLCFNIPAGYTQGVAKHGAVCWESGSCLDDRLPLWHAQL